MYPHCPRPACPSPAKRTEPRVRLFCVAVLVASLWAPAASAQQKELLQLALQSGHLSQTSIMSAAEAPGDLQAHRDSMARLLQTLENTAPAASTGERYPDALRHLQQSWQELSRIIDRLISLEPAIAIASADVEAVQTSASTIQASAEHLVQQMLEHNSNCQLIYFASRQSTLLERLQRRSQEVLKGGHHATTAADGLRRDFMVLSRAQKALSAGDAQIGIDQLDHPPSRALSEQIDGMLDEIKVPLERLVGAAQTLTDANEQTGELQHALEEFQRRLIDLQGSLR